MCASWSTTSPSPSTAASAHGLADAPNLRFDTVVMGLGTYRPALDAGLTSPYAHLRQYVVSSTLAHGRRGGTSGCARAGGSPVCCCRRSTN